MKQHQVIPLAAALTLTLTACGGGSSGDDTFSQGDGKGGLQTIKPKNISLKTYTYTNSCDIDTPYSTDIVFHDKDGKPVGKAKTNAEGVFSGEIPKDTKHVSVLGEEVIFNQAHKKIRTRLDIENRSNLGDFRFLRSDKDCGCETYSLDSSNLSFLSSGYTLHGSFSENVYDSIKICSEEEVYFTVLSGDRSESKAAVVTVPKFPKIIKLTDEDFSHQGVEVAHQISSTVNSISTMGYFEKHDGFRNWQHTINDDFEPLYVYPSLSEHNFYLQTGKNLTYVGNIKVSLDTHTRSRVTNDGSYVLNELPIPPTTLSDDFVTFATSSDLRYDFSSADDRLTNVFMDFSFRVDDAAETRFQLEVQGYITGQVPDLSFGDLFPEPTGNIKLEQLKISLYGYPNNPTDKKSVDGLHDELAQGKHFTKEKFSNYLATRLHTYFN